MLEIVN
jgi:26S proteasome regulatory subunit T1